MIITISRDYGAGGHTIGQAVAKELGIEFYDKDIIRGKASVSGLDADMISNGEEEFTLADNIISTINPVVYNQKSALHSIEAEVILDLVKKTPDCVILGRCADVILADAGIESLNVYIYADDIHRAMRVGEMIGSQNASEIQRTMKKKDRARRSYYTRFTGKRWGEAANFNLCVDSGALGYETCVKLICAAAKG